MLPWLFFLFCGTLDFGIFSYAAICTQNAARAAADAVVQNNALPSASSGSAVCNAVLDEMKYLSNMQGVAFSSYDCTGASTSTHPVNVTPGLVAGPDNNTCCGASSAIQISVQYQSSSVLPIPGLVPQYLYLTRTATVRSYSGLP